VASTAKGSGLGPAQKNADNVVLENHEPWKKLLKTMAPETMFHMLETWWI
jgi:hypothetical protein